MIQLKIYNEDRIRRYGYFPTIKDPEILENTLLRIINEDNTSKGIKLEKKFDITNPQIANRYFTYYTTSNFNNWGTLPMSYIYNDMVRHIKNLNTKINFILTLESIFIEFNPEDYSLQGLKMYLPYEIIGQYITENYIASYNYMKSNANGIMVAYIEKPNGIIAYILSVGFDPVSMSKWYSSSDDVSDPNSIPYIRYKSLIEIANTINSKYRIDLGFVDLETGGSRLRESINGCISEVNNADINTFRKKSKFDTNIKYANFNIDQNALYHYDLCRPACMYDLDGTLVSKFNSQGDYKTDYRILKKQVDMIEIDKKKNNREGI